MAIDKQNMTPAQKEVWDTINEMMDVSYGCAESFVASVGKYLWGEMDDSIKMISTGFSGGVGGTHEELCGGVSGAAIILGLLYGRTTNDESKMIRCKRLISEHRDRFVAEFGTTVCQELRDAQFGADEQNPCSALIAPAAFMLLDILEEEKEREAQSEAQKGSQPKADLPDLEAFMAENAATPSKVLLAQLEYPELPHQHRDWIGERLSIVGDPRRGVGLDEEGLPEIIWLDVAAGSVQVERAGNFASEPFKVAKFPVTYAQFQVFLEAEDGFSNPDWWQGLAADPAHQSAPGEQQFRLDNNPRENVSWFDAVAFCRWLTAKSSPELVEDGWQIRLPTEWEWQQAATGGNPENKFPWGLDWDDSLAHTKHNQLNKSMAVGMYPAGAAPNGALDMSGNVWEWCLNCYEDPENLDLSRTERRVLRGGSWYHWGSYAHTDMRSRYYPDHRYNAGGFRVVLAKTLV
jgi:C_GCAxxG_C_C family probable redox protein